MSKSDADPKSRIELSDTQDVIQMKFKKALTDTTPEISHDPDGRLAISNLVEIHAAITDSTPDEIVKEAEGMVTVQYKEHLANVVNDKLSPIRDEINRLKEDRGFVERVLDSGAEEAKTMAGETYSQVLKAVGFR